MNAHKMHAWTLLDATDLYNINGWSNGYFGISEKGHVDVTPPVTDGPSIDV